MNVTAQTFLVENPATRAQLAELEIATPAHIDDIVCRAREALHTWASVPLRRRAQIMIHIADLLDENARRLAELESCDNGRPLRETLAQQRIVGDWYRYFGGWCDKIEGETIPVDDDCLVFTERVPVGVCAAITPWNHPLVIATKKIAPALACGNAVIVKPSELAPLSVIEFEQIALEAGLPEGVLQVVTGLGETGAALAAHPGIDRVDLTGSTPTAVKIQEQSARTMKRLGFELGGKGAMIFFEDVDLDVAVQNALWGGFIAQGQTCISGSRVLVQRSILDSFVDAYVLGASEIRLGDPLDPHTQMGPLISDPSLTRIEAIVALASKDPKASILCGGRRPDLVEPLSRGHFYAPTVVLTSDHEIQAAQDEIFGPVITLIPFDSPEEAVAIANGVPYGLGASIWTNDIRRAHQTARALRCGIVWINDHHRTDPGAPWGGFKLSGYGRENGNEAIRMFTEAKLTWVRLAEQGSGWYETSEFVRLN